MGIGERCRRHRFLIFHILTRTSKKRSAKPRAFICRRCGQQPPRSILRFASAGDIIAAPSFSQRVLRAPGAGAVRSHWGLKTVRINLPANPDDTNSLFGGLDANTPAHDDARSRQPQQLKVPLWINIWLAASALICLLILYCFDLRLDFGAWP
jgi:hypothetical protein